MGKANVVIDEAEINRLKHLMETLDLNQKQFAAVLDVSPVFVTKLFQYKKRPGREVLQRLVGFGISMEWLFFGNGDMVSNPVRYRQLKAQLPELCSR